ncbi:MAG TPA: hypothetical protein VLH83_05795 [Chthoniobacterales bacterium]|nr:hypothetical protein [Chthoniobacterales bacterium]
MNEPPSPRFYFALLRLLAKMRGGDPTSAESNAAEAWFGSVALYGISYLYFAAFVPDTLSWWVRGLFFVALAFLVMLFWLLMLYLNSLILKLLHTVGLFRSLPIRRGQSVLLVVTATAMAVALSQRDSIVSELGAIWLIAVTMNLVAATILALGNGDPSRP